MVVPFNDLTKFSNVRYSNTAICLVGGTIAAIILFVIGLRRKERLRRCKEFVRAGQVEELYIYPIKSCRGNKVDWLDCAERGSTHGEERDRHFLVVDALNDNIFLTARIYPKMVLIGARVRRNVLTVQFPPNDKQGDDEATVVEVNLDDMVQRNELRRARSWPPSQLRMVEMEGLKVEDGAYSMVERRLPNENSLFLDAKTDGLDCGDEVANALTDFLGTRGKRQLRLIYFAGDNMYTERDQPSKSDYWSNNSVPEVNDKIGYADLASYMAFSAASVDDLNSHLASQGISIDARNFRPNIVVSGLPPFDEDQWLYVRAGDAEFVCYKPCTRCVLTTVNPDQGEKSKQMEPLRELRKYRLAPGKLLDVYKESPVFGVNMAILKWGRVSVGDAVWIQYKPRPF